MMIMSLDSLGIKRHCVSLTILCDTLAQVYFLDHCDNFDIESVNY